jgi:hypothetical protein
MRAYDIACERGVEGTGWTVLDMLRTTSRSLHDQMMKRNASCQFEYVVCVTRDQSAGGCVLADGTDACEMKLMIWWVATSTCACRLQDSAFMGRTASTHCNPHASKGTDGRQP